MDGQLSIAGFLTPYAYEDISSLDAAIGLTSSKLHPTDEVTGASMGQARAVMVTQDGGIVRWTIDGTTPTSTVGHKIADGGDMPALFSKQAMKLLRFIKVSGTPIVRVTYLR